MAKKLLILGNPGTGKSTAISSLNPETTFIINCDEKDLPFRGYKSKYKAVYTSDKKFDLQSSNLFNTTRPSIILSLLRAISDQKSDVKTIVIDTITMMMIAEFMNKAQDKGFEKFTQFALDVFNVIKSVDSLRDDLTVIFLAHTETVLDSEGVRMTQFLVPGGKLVGEKIKIEGMFTTVLYSEVVIEQGTPHYYFVTQNNGKNTCKSPAGMFEDLRIPNDFDFVLKSIENYNNGE